MYIDRKYPGKNNIGLLVFPTFGYFTLTGAFSYELWLKRSALLGSTGNIAKLVAVPFLGLMTLRNLDIISDTIRYRKKYPEMYQ
mmetsp:Transcript_15857/g.2630  ORF Transcript_15857/g.2630 Transcript_15857/m.2630 type:complete len:84 (+) Transcript_15857:130-381(+)